MMTWIYQRWREPTKGDKSLLNSLKEYTLAAYGSSQSTDTKASAKGLFPLIFIAELPMPNIKGTNVCLVLLQKSMFSLSNV